MGDPLRTLPALHLTNELAAALKQARSPKLVQFLGAVAAGVKASLTRQDAGPVNSLRIDARLAGEHGANIRAKTIRKTNPDGDLVFDLEIYYPDNATLVEKFSGVSMVDTHRRYVETIVNTGLGNEGPSQWVTVLDMDSATPDQRPADAGPTALTTVAGANEVTATGVKRGDAVAAGLIFTIAAGNFTAVAPVDPTDFFCTQDNKVISVAGVAASRSVVLLILPKDGS